MGSGHPRAQRCHGASGRTRPSGDGTSWHFKCEGKDRKTEKGAVVFLDPLLETGFSAQMSGFVRHGGAELLV